MFMMMIIDHRSLYSLICFSITIFTPVPWNPMIFWWQRTPWSLYFVTVFTIWSIFLHYFVTVLGPDPLLGCLKSSAKLQIFRTRFCLPFYSSLTQLPPPPSSGSPPPPFVTATVWISTHHENSERNTAGWQAIYKPWFVLACSRRADVNASHPSSNDVVGTGLGSVSFLLLVS
jgi:hypothetical protein